MTPLLRITRHPYEEPFHVHLFVYVEAARHRAEIELYTAATDFAEAADALTGFPGDQPEFRWELGSEDPESRCAYYFLFRVWQVASNGRCAVGIRFNNNNAPPDRRVSEFSFLVNPADLDRLADRFREFAELRETVLAWSVAEDGAR